MAETPAGKPLGSNPEIKSDPSVAARTAASDKATTNPSPPPSGAGAPAAGGPGVINVGRTNDPHSDDRKRGEQDAVRDAPLPPGTHTAEQDAQRRRDLAAQRGAGDGPDDSVTGLRLQLNQAQEFSFRRANETRSAVLSKLSGVRSIVESMSDRIKSGTVLSLQNMNEILEAVSRTEEEVDGAARPRKAGAADPAPQAADKLHGQAQGHRPLGQPDTMGTVQPSPDFPGGQAPSPMPGRVAGR